MQTIELYNIFIVMYSLDRVPIVMAYIDPGTGSALFAVLMGLISIVVYGLKGLIIKLRTGIGRKEKTISDSYTYVIYSDSKRYWNLFKPICDVLEERNIIACYLTQSVDDPAFDENYKYVKKEFIGEGNKGVSKMNFLNADIVLSTTPSLDVFQWKRSRNVKYYIHIPHACSDITLYRMFGLDYYDAVLTCNQFQIDQIRQLENIRNIKAKDLKIAGLTYFDAMKKRLDKTEKIKNDIPVVLLAPSWGPSSLLNQYGSLLINQLIETGYKIIIRPHPQSFESESDLINSLMSKYQNIEWNRDTDNFEVLNKADILISDFSGVIFDFSFVFDKPVIYNKEKFDDSVYDHTWLDSEMWTFKTLSKIGVEINSNNIDSIKQIIDDCLNSPSYKEDRETARNEAWQNKGKSAETIVDYMVSKYEESVRGNVDV